MKFNTDSDKTYLLLLSPRLVSLNRVLLYKHSHRVWIAVVSRYGQSGIENSNVVRDQLHSYLINNNFNTCKNLSLLVN